MFLVLFLSVGSGPGFTGIFALVMLIVVLPAVLVLALSGRNLRVVGPFVAIPVLIACAGLWIWAWLALPRLRASAIGAMAGASAIVPVVVVLPACQLPTGSSTCTSLKANSSIMLRSCSSTVSTLSPWMPAMR
jgi:hypothetical protein